uniref:histidine kinase n=1 Tax=Geobacter metallireducens TaxID=28232 RepID=A0A831XN19_GEOME
MKVNIRRLLFLGSFLSAIVPLVIVGGVSLGLLKTHLGRELDEAKVVFARSVGDQIAIYLREPVRVMTTVRLHLEGERHGTAHTVELIDGTLAANDYFEGIYLLDTAGRVRHAALRNGGEAGRDMGGNDFSGVAAVRAAMASGGVSWAPLISLQSGEPVVAFSLPVRGGFILATLRLDDLAGIIARAGASSRFVPFLIEPGGRVIAHPDASVVARQERVGGLSALRSSAEGMQIGAVSLGGEEYHAVAVPIQELSWRLLVAQRSDVSQEPVRQMQTIVLAGMGLTILLAAAAAALGNLAISRPFRRLGEEARKVTDHRYGEVRPVGTICSEIELLSETLGSMARTVQARETELRDRNEELAMAEEELRQQLDEYQRSQDHLTESEERYRLLVDSSPDAILIHAAGRYVFANPAALKLYGAAHPDQLVGRPITDFVHPDSHQAVAERLRLLYNERRPVPLAEQRLIRLDGTVVDVDVISIPFTYLGEPAVQVVLRDISQRKLAEATIARARDFYVKLFDEFPLPVWRADASGYCNYHNRTWLSLTGRTFDEEAGTGWVEALHPDDRARCLTLWQEAFTARRPLIVEYRLRRHDGSYRTILDCSTPYDDLDGEFAGFIGACVDITDRKNAEEEVRRLNAELEERVRERTVLLETANRELESFSYSVSHDLRAPLRHIDGFSAMLLEDCGDSLPETAVSYLERIKTASRRMGQLIDDLLDLSRVSRSAMRRESVDLSRMARELAREYEEANPARRVTFEIADGVVAVGDPTLLRVALHNLLDNAWKYSGKKDSARIRFGETVVDGERAIFVSDDGAGFDMRYVNKLFGPFQRLHSADEFEGTGIGLATVQRIAQRHGGRAWAEGEEGKGATFYLAIP